MISKSIGQKLKQKREELNLTIKAVASELGISARAYLDIENGLVDIKASKLATLKNILQIKVADMFDESMENVGSRPVIEASAGDMGNIINNISKELLERNAELYERIIALEKGKAS